MINLVHNARPFKTNPILHEFVYAILYRIKYIDLKIYIYYTLMNTWVYERRWKYIFFTVIKQI